MILRFNPRTPCGVRLGRLLACKHLFLFQSTHSLRSATHQIVHYGGALPVSIHALLAECDGGGPCLGPGRPGFNPRTPCGVRQWLWLRATRGRWFQSTHSLRSATHQIVHYGGALPVSIHALLAECDGGGPCLGPGRPGFNPRTPCGVRQWLWLRATRGRWFQSTHSLRSATVRPVPPGWAGRCFNPRTPCGVRHFKRRMLPVSFSFQSTHSLRSATQRLGDILRLNWFQSTHSLRSATNH